MTFRQGKEGRVAGGFSSFAGIGRWVLSWLRDSLIAEGYCLRALLRSAFVTLALRLKRMAIPSMLLGTKRLSCGEEACEGVGGGLVFAGLCCLNVQAA